jgi:hypothetical protein
MAGERRTEFPNVQVFRIASRATIVSTLLEGVARIAGYRTIAAGLCAAEPGYFAVHRLGHVRLKDPAPPG